MAIKRVEELEALLYQQNPVAETRTHKKNTPPTIPMEQLIFIL